MLENINYLPYFRIYLLWHDRFSNGHHLADYLFDKICGDRKHPLLQGLGIPVHFRSTPLLNTNVPRTICLDNCLNSAIFIFVDEEMVICESWQRYVEELWDDISLKKPHHKIYPIAFTPLAYNFSPKIAHINFIRVIFQEHEIDVQKQKLLINILHESCRQLKQVQSISTTNKNLAPPPVRLFLSHAKYDGLEETQDIRRQIEENEVIKTFFDTLDIPPGYDFQEEIEKNLKDCALLIFQTDAYASSYWCRWEVLTAKKYIIPILLINAINTGEERSFPYVGNIPTVRWQQTNYNIFVIIAKILLEVLRYIYFPEYVKKLQEIRRIPAKAIILPCAPELLTQVQSCQESQQLGDTPIIYPDPPLGDDEMDILRSLKSNIKAWTPSQPIPSSAADEQKPLSGKVVGISISNSPDLERLGFSESHLKRALIEISRHLLAQGASLAYGGDLRPDGFTQDLVEMVKAYNKQGNNKQEKRIFNFLAWPLNLEAPIVWRAKYKNEVSIRAISLPEDIKRAFDLNEKEFLKPEDIVGRYVWMRCLTAMREQMTEEIDARIILGGQVSNYKGAFPGIAEEASLAIAHNKPLFVLGAFGGCAKAVGEALIGHNPEQLTWEWQASENDTYTKPTYSEVVNFYNEQSSQGSPHLPIDYTALVDRFHHTGLNGINNKLSEAENRALFHSEDLDEMIYLTLKGLQS
jgi:hypothetical protein